MVARILVCDPIHPSGIKALRSGGFHVDENPHITESELMSRVNDYEVIIVRGRTKVTRNIIQEGKRLKVIARAGVGTDNIDLEAAKRGGVRVITTPGAPSQSVAELTIALILSLLRKIPLADHSMKQGKWIKAQLHGNELKGKTLGVIGAGGRIGFEVARIAKQGFGAHVIGYDAVPIQERASELGMEVAGSIEELLGKSDIVTIHVPYSTSTQNLIDKSRISKMKENAILVNTSRGRIVDEMAVLQALKTGKLKGVGLDVYHDEPPREEWEKELVQLPDGKSVCTCHIGGQSEESQISESMEVAEKIIGFFNVSDA